MNQTFYKSLTPALLGAVTLAAVGIPQAAQAGTIRARSTVDFTEVTLELIDNDGSGDGIANVWTEAFGGVNAGGNVTPPPTPGVFVSDGPSLLTDGPLDTRTLIGGTAPLDSNGPNFADGSAEISLSGNILTTGNDAEVFLTGEGPSVGAGEGEYTVFTPSFASGNPFAVTEGDTLDLEGFLNTELFVEITDWEPGDTKIAEADYTATYEILLNGEVVFTAPVLADELNLVNANDSLTETSSVILDDIDYTFENDGFAEVAFFAREQAEGTNSQTTPEPSSLAGLLALGGISFLLKRRNRR